MSEPTVIEFSDEEWRALDESRPFARDTYLEGIIELQQRHIEVLTTAIEYMDTLSWPKRDRMTNVRPEPKRIDITSVREDRVYYCHECGHVIDRERAW